VVTVLQSLRENRCLVVTVLQSLLENRCLVVSKSYRYRRKHQRSSAAVLTAIEEGWKDGRMEGWYGMTQADCENMAELRSLSFEDNILLLKAKYYETSLLKKK
jgi:hypothetical protein